MLALGLICLFPSFLRWKLRVLVWVLFWYRSLRYTFPSKHFLSRVMVDLWPLLPPKYIEVPCSLHTSGCDLIWKWGHYRQIQMRSRIGCLLVQGDWCWRKRGKCFVRIGMYWGDSVKMQRERGAMSWSDSHKPWNTKASRQTPEAGEGRKTSLEPVEKLWPNWHLDFGLLASRIEAMISVVLIHPFMILCYGSPRKLKPTVSCKFWFAVFSFFSVQNIFCFPWWYLWPINWLIDYSFICILNGLCAQCGASTDDPEIKCPRSTDSASQPARHPTHTLFRSVLFDFQVCSYFLGFRVPLIF